MPEVAQLSEHRQKRKQLDVTDAMLEQINFVTDTDVSADDIVVFEATALNTLPLSKAGSIFENARATRSTLSAMATSVNDKNEAVPIHTLHLQGDELPVGKVFHAYVDDMVDGNSELRAQFFLPRSEAALIERINLGILDEVSVGLKSEQLLCSKCGFDYFAEDTDFMHMWDRTCENDHTIGVDGTHAVLSGLDKWMELSLVSRGAATNAKIHGRARKVMPQEQQDRLAANGFSPDAVTLFASPTTMKEEVKMTKKPEVTLETPAASTAEFDAQVAFEGLNASIQELVTALTPTEVPAETVEADSTAEALTELAATVETLKASIEELKTAPKPTASTADLQAETPAGGLSASAVTDADKSPKSSNFASFKSRK